MNKEINFCSQCAATVNPGKKFCSNCGHDLTNSSTKTTSEKTLKVEVTNVAVEKGFKAIEGVSLNEKKKEEKRLHSPLSEVTR